MKALIVLFLLMSHNSLWAHNPFENYLIVPKATNTDFYPQRAPFPYPFEVSEEVTNKDLDLNQITQDYPENALDHVAGFYDSISFLPSLFVYQYPFPIHPEWEILPHPYVKSIKSPKKWIDHFKLELKPGEGIRSIKFHEELNEITQTQVYAGNKLKYFKSPNSFREILKRLKSAKNHAFISNYLFHCDKGSEALLELIGKKVKAGVRIFIIYDKFFSKTNPGCHGTLKELGAKVLLHRGRKLSHIFHEKMYVFDGEYAVIDGQNIIAIQTLSSGTNNLINDAAIGVKGPMVTEIANRFIHHWQKVLFGKMPQDLIDLYEKQSEDIQKYSTIERIKESLEKAKGQGLCRLVTKDPGVRNSTVLNMYLHTIKTTKNYLFFNYMDAQYKNVINNAPGEKILKAVSNQANADKNLRVDMLTNNWKTPVNVKLPVGMSAPENFITRLSLRLLGLFLKSPEKQLYKIRNKIQFMMKEKNFHWWSYSQFMHAKTLMSDNIWTIVGTHNLNMASEKSSYELALACLDTGLAEEMQKSIIEDALNSVPVPLD